MQREVALLSKRIGFPNVSRNFDDIDKSEKNIRISQHHLTIRRSMVVDRHFFLAMTSPLDITNGNSTKIRLSNDFHLYKLRRRRKLHSNEEISYRKSPAIWTLVSNKIKILSFHAGMSQKASQFLWKLPRSGILKHSKAHTPMELFAPLSSHPSSIFSSLSIQNKKPNWEYILIWFTNWVISYNDPLTSWCRKQREKKKENFLAKFHFVRTG